MFIVTPCWYCHNVDENSTIDSTSLPPAAWHTDPEDETQYRYWDGTAWTEHRAPRYAKASATAPDFGTMPSNSVPPSTADSANDSTFSAQVTSAPVAPVGNKQLRGIGELLGYAFQTLGAKWSSLLVGALVALVGWAAFFVGAVWTLSLLFKGEFGEVVDRATEPGFDAEDPVHEAYFDSLEFDFSFEVWVPVVLGLLVSWAAVSFSHNLAAHIALSRLREASTGFGNACARALRRVPRHMGMGVQVALLYVVMLFAFSMIGALLPLSLIVTIPVFLLSLLAGPSILSMGWLVASIGPKGWSLKRGFQLNRRRFWKIFGRFWLAMIIVVAAGGVIGVAIGIFTANVPVLWIPGQIAGTLINALLGFVPTIALVAIYFDAADDTEAEFGHWDSASGSDEGVIKPWPDS